MYKDKRMILPGMLFGMGKFIVLGLTGHRRKYCVVHGEKLTLNDVFFTTTSYEIHNSVTNRDYTFLIETTRR